MKWERIGDAERDAAVDALREHTSAGRLTFDEFDERMSAALAARTRGDLRGLFVDLPGGVPIIDIVPVVPTKDVVKRKSRRGRLDTVRVVAVTVVWLAFFAAMFLGAIPWWLFFIPVLVSGIISDEIGKRVK